MLRCWADYVNVAFVVPKWQIEGLSAVKEKSIDIIGATQKKGALYT